METLTPPTDDQMEHFQAWRATALQMMPYFATLLFSMRPVATEAVDTFAVDPSHRVYINFENCIPKGAAFCAQGLLHEGGHLLGEHHKLAEIAGVGNHERDLWNLAGDYAINDDLRDAGCKELAAHGVFAKMIGEPDYKDPLHYMDALRKKQAAAAKRRQQQSGQGQKGQSGSGSPQQGQQGQNPQQGQQSAGQQGPLKGCGTGAGGRAGGFELDENETLGGTADAATSIEKELVRIRTAVAIQEHQKQNGRGSVPAGIISDLEGVLEPTKTPWERILAGQVRRCIARKLGYQEETYTRRNRRRMNDTLRSHSGATIGRIIAPGYIKPVPSIHFYRDTSGSVSNEELQRASSEVVTIAQKLAIRGEDLVVTDVDAIVHQSVEFRGQNKLRKVQGRGGTNMIKAIEHACELKQKPTVIVIATDCGTPWPVEKPIIPVIVLAINAPQYSRDAVPSWAIVVDVQTAAAAEDAE